MSRMLRNVILISCLLITASGCTTLDVALNMPQDPRTPAQQQADMQAAAKELAGQYVVIDSRNEIAGFEIEKAEILPGGSGAIFALTFKGSDVDPTNSNKTIPFVGTKCSGRSFSTSTSIFCSEVTVFSFISIKKYINHETKIESAALLGGFEPLQVRAGDYVLTIASKSGRSRYYLLRRL
jgi:hypothetical protein